MREIKFRAWDGKKMHYQVRFGGVKDGIPLSPSVWDEKTGWTILSGDPVLEIMQFTGLYDINGREIYEGDIVRGKYGKNGIVKNYEIRWLVGHFAAVDRNNITGDEHYYPIGLLEGEVIGNIYENKHLLEEVNNESK